MAYLYWIHLPEHTNIELEGYIGITSKSISSRWSKHIYSSTYHKSKNYTIYRAICKYPDTIRIKALVEGSLEYVRELEKKLRPARNIGWNIASGGSATQLGAKRSDETKDKLRKSHLGKVLSRESIEKRLASLKGHVWSKETNAKRSIAHKAIKPWKRSLSKPVVWSRANDVYKTLQENPTIGCLRLSTILNMSGYCFAAIVRYIKSGWIPSEDIIYQTWIKDYKGTI